MKTLIMILITSALATAPLYGESAQPPPAPAEEQPEVLTSGPVHEAFAEPVNLQVQADLVAPSQPPPVIEENPPAERPVGDQFVWVPGYWAWDSQRNGYIWVSGYWRAAPPSSYWVPGYWAQTPAGCRWIAGFWAPSGTRQLEYLPAPPVLEDVAPPGIVPSPDKIWVPPCWYWYQGQYVRRPGYWLVAQPDWVWVPSHYIWTPRGYVFAAGHWDYSLSRRGVLFAPVYFPRHVYERPGFSYSLSVVVDIGNLQFSLFTCPRYSHYYFGDYFDDTYVSIGIFPWFECEKRHTWYDPIFEHDRWRHQRMEPRWEEHQRIEYDRRRADKDLRPSRTYHEMETRLARLPESKRRDIELARPMSRVVADKKSPMKFEPIKADARQRFLKNSTDLNKFRDDRSRWESSRAGPQTIQPSGEHKGLVTTPQERRETVTSPAERKGTMTQPGERRQTMTPPAEQKGQAPPPSEHKEQMAPPSERKPATVPSGEAGRNEPDRVKIPSPPITGKQGGFSFFRKGPPSKPADEQKTEVRETRGKKDTRSEKDTRRGEEPRGDKGDRGKNN
jgi:hypothetical protein